jgi:hypothetical protein
MESADDITTGFDCVLHQCSDVNQYLQRESGAMVSFPSSCYTMLIQDH